MVPQIEHHWIGGVYFRKMCLPAGHCAKTHVHAYDHGSICARGRGEVRSAGGAQAYAPGSIIEIKAGIEHEIVAFEDSIWICAHAADEDEDLDKVAIGLVT